ncbi:hypothetical protein PVK74_13645 [Micromonospora chalcea]|uniref:hypothetical protein n=1 Tax=Micromonospora chalcea TaxID=1874 RepID=UPI002377FC69|nr:hypothetical protein [Micromonospora chalcea]WDQ02784.1 hypothetical protein PVK74_13645 [Micromonospora chalcea]
MRWAELAIKLLQVVIWPAVVVTLGILLRRSIPDLVSRIQRADTPVGSIEFFEKRDQVDELVAVAAEMLPRETAAIDDRPGEPAATFSDGSEGISFTLPDINDFGVSFSRMRHPAQTRSTIEFGERVLEHGIPNPPRLWEMWASIEGPISPSPKTLDRLAFEIESYLLKVGTLFGFNQVPARRVLRTISAEYGGTAWTVLADAIAGLFAMIDLARNSDDLQSTKVVALFKSTHGVVNAIYTLVSQLAEMAASWALSTRELNGSPDEASAKNDAERA